MVSARIWAGTIMMPTYSSWSSVNRWLRTAAIRGWHFFFRWFLGIWMTHASVQDMITPECGVDGPHHRASPALARHRVFLELNRFVGPCPTRKLLPFGRRSMAPNIEYPDSIQGRFCWARLVRHTRSTPDVSAGTEKRPLFTASSSRLGWICGCGC